MFWPLALVSLLMWSGSLLLAVDAARKAKLPKGAPWWSRALVGTLYLIQPPIRAWYRATYDLRLWRPRLSQSYYEIKQDAKVISSCDRDLYWTSDRGLGREALLHEVVDEAKRVGWLGVFNNGWATWDVKLVGDLWHTLLVHTVTEELGSNRRFTRARITAQATIFNRVVSIASLIWTIAALVDFKPLPLLLAMLASAAALMQNVRSRRTCLRAAISLVARAGRAAGLLPADTAGHSTSDTSQLKVPQTTSQPAETTSPFVSPMP
jgi:hypothetical protein